MKAVQQKIKLGQLLNCYSLERLARYRKCPQILAKELNDIKTIIQFSQTQFTPRVVDLRKKSLEYDKIFKAWDKTSKETIPQLQQRRSQSNHNFAYSIHCLNPQSIVPQFPQRRLLTELKLKFLESESVDEADWQKWFCPQENVLKIKAHTHKFEIKLGITLGETKSAVLFWQVFDVTCDQHHHPQLFYFLNQYLTWFRKTYQDCENKIIKRLEVILNNLMPLLIFLTIREEVSSKGGEIQKQTLKLNFNKNAAIKFMWKFDIFDNLQDPTLVFSINDQESFKLFFKPNNCLGQILFNSQSGNSKFVSLKPIQLQDRHFLFQFSLKIYNYLLNIKKFESQYDMLNSSFSLLIRVNKNSWKSQKFGTKQQNISKVKQEGIWGELIVEENAVVFKLQQDLSLTHPQFQKGFLGHLLNKMQLLDLVEHVKLRHEITKNNKQFEFKIYTVDFRLSEKQIIYQFRSFRYGDIQKPIITKEGKDWKESYQLLEFKGADWLKPINQQVIYDDLVITVKIASNFSQVTYSAYKVVDGPQYEKQINENNFPKKLREYRERPKKGRYDWKRVYEIISYFCKCYLVQRSFNKRMTDDQRRMTVCNFK